jgi:tRNA (guanine-N7-)-methyltransferase
MTNAQSKALRELWPDYGLDFSAETVDFNAVFDPMSGATGVDDPELILEIGFGMGDSLFESMQQAPHSRFIGIEVHAPGVGHLLNLAAASSLTNLRVYRHDVKEVLQHCFGNDCLDAVQIFFPDPWPKKKHHKRRLVSDEFLRLLATRLKKGGILHLATDWIPYAEQMQMVVHGSELFEINAEARCRPETKYERRALKLGHSITDLIYRKK